MGCTLGRTTKMTDVVAIGIATIIGILLGAVSGFYGGHITAGGQFPTAAWRETLAGGAVDSVVLHEGEAPRAAVTALMTRETKAEM